MAVKRSRKRTGLRFYQILKTVQSRQLKGCKVQNVKVCERGTICQWKICKRSSFSARMLESENFWNSERTDWPF